MRKSVFAIFQYSLFLGAGIFLVWWSIDKLSPEEYADFVHALKTANYYLLIPVFFILIASHFSRAIRWKILMKSMGYYPKTSNTFCAVMIGYLANFAFPRLGEVLKCTILGKYEKVPADKLVGTILVERAIDLVSFFIIILISLLTQANVVGEYAMDKFRVYVQSKNTGTTLFKLALLLFLISAFFILLRYLVKKFPESKLILKIRSIVKGVMEGILTIKNMQHKGRFLLHSLFIWGCYLGGTYLGFFAIQQTSQLPVLASFPVLAFGTIAMILTPGGIGLYPVFLMEAMKLDNIPQSYGTANGWLQLSAQFLIVLVVGFLCLLILPYINKRKHETGKQHTEPGIQP